MIHFGEENSASRSDLYGEQAEHEVDEIDTVCSDGYSKLTLGLAMRV